MLRRICVIFSCFSVFFLLTPLYTQASASSGTVSQRSTIQSRTQPTAESLKNLAQDRYNQEIYNRDIAMANRLDMKDWTIASKSGMTLAQAFGVDKGTISYPKLKARLPKAEGKAKTSTPQYQGLPGGDKNPPGSGTIKSNISLGKEMAAAQPYGWTGRQWDALYQVWEDESGWSQTAENPSGAYGIPQSLPGSKMASAGKNWKTDPATQIKWGLLYIYQTYGTPEAALAHENAYGWY